MQLLLFEEPVEEKQHRKLNELEEKYHSLRKSQHARISMLNKEVKELKSKVDFLESHICKNGMFL
jgi:polyhydroxyalkanoate synthesis regulator phasin